METSPRMSETDPVPSSSSVVSSRYQLLGELGAGGMATVHRAVDTKTGMEVALKRLRARSNPLDHVRDIAHLEHEYHTLAQLAHPRVVSVFDYGVDSQQPYYTMELLDGGDLQNRTPLDWRTACAFARDICSALSLLHSRRLVHRDLSPRNVRCTGDGRAKLIDFGAMVPMGPSKSVVGTPAVCAPELVRLQPLDGRTDLYALGATLYYMLVGRYPYPARTFGQLESMWKLPLVAPSGLASGIPAALDALVLSLLQLDITARPSSASEVMQRLGCIAGLALDEQLHVSQAYLTTPNLIGRAKPLARVRKYASGLLRERGRAIWVDGAPGVGRSRFLDACILEGKLIGAVVVRADASDAAAGEFGVALELGRRLLEAASENAVDAALPHWHVLARALPELNAHGSASLPPSAATTADADTQLRQALQAWFLAVSRARPLMLVVDDAQRADEQSAALIALLARDVQRHRLVIATSVAQDGTPRSPALRLLAEASVKLELLALTDRAGAQRRAGECCSAGRACAGQLCRARLQRLEHRVGSRDPRLGSHLRWRQLGCRDPHDTVRRRAEARLEPDAHGALRACAACGAQAVRRRDADCRQPLDQPAQAAGRRGAHLLRLHRRTGAAWPGHSALGDRQPTGLPVRGHGRGLHVGGESCRPHVASRGRCAGASQLESGAS